MAPSTTTVTSSMSKRKGVVATGEAANGAIQGTLIPENKESVEVEVEANVKDNDFFWTYTEEPHRTRRLAIIKAHPEVTKLCGHEPLTKYVVAFVVTLQCFIAYTLRDTSFWSWKFWALAYVFGATANQNLFLAIHEISHNLAFRSAQANRLFAIFANLPIGIPYSASFRPYHLTHHKSLGVDGVDVDLPTAFEAAVLDSILGKAFFCTFQILFYALRPMAIYQVPFTWVSFLNVVVQLAFDSVVLKTCGFNSMLYFVLSSFLAGSLHPLTGHFISEHYVFDHIDATARDPANGIPLPETYSYYGPLNFLVYNVGLHNEHHDFPAVAWTKLPVLHEIAKEFYQDLPQHRSWTYVLWRFILDETVGMKCRVKRKTGGRKVGTGGSVNKKQPEVQAKVADWKEDEIEA